MPNLSHRIKNLEIAIHLRHFILHDKEDSALEDAVTKQWTEKIGNKLRERRKALGLSLEDLSRLSGSTVPTLSNIERGKRDVKLSTLVSLATALRLELSHLFIDQNATQQTPRRDSTGYNLDDD